MRSIFAARGVRPLPNPRSADKKCRSSYRPSWAKPAMASVGMNGGAQQAPRQAVLDGLAVELASWPFSDAPDTECYVSRGLMDGSTVVETVIHDFHGDWQVLDETDPTEENILLVCLAEVVRRHPAVGALAELPHGFRADMDFDLPEWVAQPLQAEDE